MPLLGVKKVAMALDIRQCGYFPTNDIRKALKVCFRGLLVRISLGCGEQYLVSRLTCCDAAPQKVTLRRCNKGYSVISVCLADASPFSICDHSTHSLITHNSTCVSCGAMRSVTQMVTGAIIQPGSSAAGFFTECGLALRGLCGTDCHSFYVRQGGRLWNVYFVLSREHTSSTTIAAHYF
jgi:hypothetical protein